MGSPRRIVSTQADIAREIPETVTRYRQAATSHFYRKADDAGKPQFAGSEPEFQSLCAGSTMSELNSRISRATAPAALASIAR